MFHQKEKMEEKRKCCYLLKSRIRSNNNIYILIALAFVSSNQQTIDCKSLSEEIASKHWHEKYGQGSGIRASLDKWIPLRNFKSPTETMKTSETLMQPINILSITRAHQNDQQAIQLQQQQQHHQMLLQQQAFLNQLAFQPTPVAAAAIPELESSRIDLGAMMASCSQLPGEESQRQCHESYHQLRELESQSPPHHNLSFNIQTGFKPSKALQMQPQQQQQQQQQHQHQPQHQQQSLVQQQSAAQQHLDASASVMNLMKAPNLYHKRSSPFIPSDAIDSLESDSGQESNDSGDENEQLSSLPPSVYGNNNNNNNNNNNHRDHRFRFNSNANGDESSSIDNVNDDNSNHLSSGAANQFAATNLHDTSSPSFSLTPPSPRARRLPSMRLRAQASSPSSSGSGNGRGNNNELSDGANSEASNSDEDFGAAERNEQEAAEASEAEAANREALAEQQQAQQEIIKAQAASEAKAIKEQQEALMMQQRLHQQIVLRRQHDLANNQSGDKNRVTERGDFNSGESFRHSNGNGNGRIRQQYSQNYRDRQQQYNDDNIIDRGEESRLSNNQLQQANLKSSYNSQMQRGSAVSNNNRNNLDIQFSDQSDNNNNEEMSSIKQDEQDEVGDYSVRRPLISSPSVVETTSPEYKSTILGAAGGGGGGGGSGGQQVAKVIEKVDSQTGVANRTDLQSAEQHQYGSHYDSLKGHQSKYYQFAESKKKGQFDSGFKRGNKKFQISGHSSQHKSHAEGHVKWHGKKGKGVQYWNYKHSDYKKKKHHY